MNHAEFQVEQDPKDSIAEFILNALKDTNLPKVELYSFVKICSRELGVNDGIVHEVIREMIGSGLIQYLYSGGREFVYYTKRSSSKSLN